MKLDDAWMDSGFRLQGDLGETVESITGAIDQFVHPSNFIEVGQGGATLTNQRL